MLNTIRLMGDTLYFNIITPTDQIRTHRRPLLVFGFDLGARSPASIPRPLSRTPIHAIKIIIVP